MAQIVLIGIAGGAASALLFASIVSGSLLSIPLFNLAPLPILIVAIGWHHLAGLLAVLVASAALAGVFGGLLFLNFIIGIGLPAWWLAYLAMLARPAGNGTAAGLEWYPVGRLVVWAAVLAALVVMLVLFMIATDAETLRAMLKKSLAILVGGMAPSADDRTLDRPARSLLAMLLEHPERVLPPGAAVLTTITQTFTLWLAARVVRISGRLRRPWPQVSAMSFPPAVLPLLAVTLAATFLPDLIGIAASVVAASLLTAYALLGLAVLHALTRQVRGRGFILGGVYGAIAVLGWPLLLMSLLGLADAALDLRGRVAGRGPPSLHG